ncbi:MAG TPA: hypothetical protein VFE33_17420 [Thermoanaerobaculia bacterium]|nr:hypothetical protein [Thermoanaerobaculia bacterium]
MPTPWKLLAMLGIALLSWSGVAAATTTVVITSPAANLTTPNQFGVVAYSYGPETVRVLQVYLDGAKQYESVWPTRNRINALVSTAAGTHRLTVQALDPNSAVVGKTTIDFSTTASPAVLSNVDQQSWNACDPAQGCHSGGANRKTPPAVPWTQAPNEDGQSVEFPTQNPAVAYDTDYWWLEHTPQSPVSHYLKYEFDLWMPAGSGNAPQAIEWECQQTVSNTIYNFAWQAQYVRSSSGGIDNVYKVYMYPPPGGSGGWEEVNLPLTRFPEGQWTHVTAEFHVDASGTVWHDALTVSNSLGSTRMDPYWFDSATGAYKSISHVPPVYTNRSNKFSNAFQLDVNGSGTAYHVFVDKMTITYVP